MKVGRYFYGPSDTPEVQRIPFGLVIKHCVRAPRNEPNALRLVEQHTSIPAPRLVDSWEHEGKTYIVMTYLRGQPLNEVFHMMSYAERDRFAKDLGACVAQLRRIPNTTPYLFSDTLGGPMVDHRIPNGRGGPCNSEADFYNVLTSNQQCTAAEFFGDRFQSLRQDHRSYFTHSDFHYSNLLVDQGRLSGIIDWECASYKPEYWEYTKTMWFSLNDPELGPLFRRALGGDQYQEELEIERLLWRYTPFPWMQSL